jgi:hypothetical protein
MAKRKSRLGIAPFDAADYLGDEDVIAEYLSAALQDSNPDVFLQAVADVAKALASPRLQRTLVWEGRASTRLSHPVPRSGMTRSASCLILVACG